MKDFIFLDIDTQYDFMHKDGMLYVPGAEKIIPKLKKITEFAKKKKINVIASTDKHTLKDREIASGAFGAHCIRGTRGQKKIIETRLNGAVSVSTKRLTPERIKKLKRIGRLMIEKQEYDAFSNPNLKLLLSGLKAAYVYGVATDYCVKAAVLNLCRMGIKAYVIKDAIKPVFKKNEKKDLALFKKYGAKFLTVRGLIKRCEGIF